MAEVSDLALLPGWLWLNLGFGDLGDDGSDAIAVALGDKAEGGCPALVLDGVVEEGGDRGVLVAAVVDDGPGHDEQVAEVRDVGALPALVAVKVGREGQGGVETVTLQVWPPRTVVA